MINTSLLQSDIEAALAKVCSIVPARFRNKVSVSSFRHNKLLLSFSASHLSREKEIK